MEEKKQEVHRQFLSGAVFSIVMCGFFASAGLSALWSPGGPMGGFMALAMG